MTLRMGTTKGEKDTERTYTMEELLVGGKQDFRQIILQVQRNCKQM